MLWGYRTIYFIFNPYLYIYRPHVVGILGRVKINDNVCGEVTKRP